MARRFTVESVFKAVDKVTAPVSRMQQRMQRFTRNVERGFRRMQRSFQKVTSGIGTVSRAAVIGVGGISTAVGLLVREFSKVENAEAAFTPLLGGAERAKQMVAELNATAASTPFQFEDIAKSANQLLPVMNGNIENTIRTFRMLGDTAGGNAQKLDSITRGFTKAMLKGRVDMESLNMIAEAGVPIFTELAASMGVSVQELSDLSRTGQITTTDLTRSFERMTQSGGIFFRGMEIASQTVSGRFSTLKDNVALTAAELGSVLAPTIKEIIDQLIGVAQRAREWVKANRELINERFLQFVEVAKQAVLGVGNAFKWLGENSDSVVTATKVIGGLVVGLKALSVVLAIVNAALIVGASTFGIIALAVVAVGAAIAALVIFWDDIKLAATDAFEAMANGWKSFKDAFMSQAKPIIDLVNAIVEPIRWAITTGASAIGSIFERGGDAQGSSGRMRRARPQIVTGSQGQPAGAPERAEVTIRDDTGRAEVTQGKLGGLVKMQPSGAF